MSLALYTPYPSFPALPSRAAAAIPRIERAPQCHCQCIRRTTRKRRQNPDCEWPPPELAVAAAPALAFRAEATIALGAAAQVAVGAAQSIPPAIAWCATRGTPAQVAPRTPTQVTFDGAPQVAFYCPPQVAFDGASKVAFDSSSALAAAAKVARARTEHGAKVARETGVTRGPHGRERVPFPREEVPALPSSSTPSSTSTSAHGHDGAASSTTPAPNGIVGPTLPVPGGNFTHVGEAANSAAGSLPTQGSLRANMPVLEQATASTPSLAMQHTGNNGDPRIVSSSAQHPTTNAHIPLAMQSRPRNASDPRTAILAAAAARAPGSPPQHIQSHAQAEQNSYRDGPARAASQSPTGPQSGYSSSRQRTPERTPERRPSAGGVERQGSSRAGGLEREGSFRTPELALNVKRLLAKPVSVSAARPRTDSSDGASTGGEGPSREASVNLRRKRYDAAGRRVERVSEDRQDVLETRSEDGHQKEGRKEEREREAEKRARDVARAFVGLHSGGEEKEKRQKNVLRRRPSAGRPSTTPSTSTPPRSQAATPPPANIRLAGPPVLSLNLSLVPMPMLFPEDGSPRGSPGESPSGSGGRLTPAGAVVQAYKRGLDASPGASPLPSPASGIEFKRKPASESDGELLAPNAKEGTPSPPVTPYYTVFGSTSGRVVAVGGPGDGWDGSGSYISASAFPSLDSGPRSARPSLSGSVGRTLTRKVSERWVRKREDSEDEVRGRGSMQDRRGKKIVRSGSRPPWEETQSPAGEPDSAVWTKSSSTLSHPEAGSFTNEPRSRRSEPALGGGSKIWKLMKRISTGGLKEKYDRGSRTLPPIPPLPPMPDLPPVPQLPKDYSSLEARTTMSSDGHSREEPNVLSRFMQSRSSVSGPRPLPPTSGIPRPSARSLPMPPPIPASHQPRAGTTTSSSSPVSSSDVASSKYFHRATGSARSSTSSYGDDTAHPPLPGAPLPKLIVGQHIVPPKELYKLDVADLTASPLEDKKVLVKPVSVFGRQNIRAPDDWTIINTPAEEHPPSLPHPPRRLPVPASSKNAHRLSQTPSIPEFSTAAPINAFAARKPVSLDKPSVESSADPLSSRPSHDDTAMSARQKRLQQRSASLGRAEPLAFRDMSEKTGPALTEKEKADRWEDLLERSDRAGGTIRLGASEPLASDDVSLRYSTASTQLLKGGTELTSAPDF
ncbi:hypothetical protein DFH07DRAFT_943160 [Mycena maculata]|uniref:Uncharacterized protein n=1 Tax=Mycena maculata TaxID=230809 RepID=A0AAD7II66_9AGAR|nr:hypothetical protein DFH07DRAFT_943160 [Mycena maculata]